MEHRFQMNAEELDVTNMDSDSSEYLCICCFSKAGEFVKLSNCKHRSFFDNITIKDIKLMDFSICSLCHVFLKKIQLFKEQIIINLDIIMDPLQSINVTKTPTRFKQSKTCTSSFVPDSPVGMPVITSVMSYNTQVNDKEVVAKPVVVSRDSAPSSRAFDKNRQLILVPKSDDHRIISMRPQAMPEPSSDAASSLLFNPKEPQFKVPNNVGHSQVNSNTNNLKLQVQHNTTVTNNKLLSRLLQGSGQSNAKTITNTPVSSSLFLNISPLTTQSDVGKLQGGGQSPINATTVNNPPVSSSLFLNISPLTTQSDVGKLVRATGGVGKIAQNSGYGQSSDLITSHDVTNSCRRLALNQQVEQLIESMITGPGVHSTSALSQCTNNKSPTYEVTNVKVKIEDDSDTDDEDSQETKTVGVSENLYDGKDGVKIEIVEVPVELDKKTGSAEDESEVTFHYGANILGKTLSEEAVKIEREAARQSDSYQSLPYKCEGCVEAYRFENGLKRHNKLRHKPIPGGKTCNICKSILKNEQRYVHHMKKHLKRYDCKACDQRFPVLKDAVEHYNSTHWEGARAEFKCPKCDYKSMIFNDYRRHKNSHRKYTCKKCGDKLFSKADYQEHIISLHKKDEMLACDACSKVFKNQLYLTRHQKAMHSRGGSDARSYYCALCDKFFYNEYTLVGHQETHAAHVGEAAKKFECHDCGRKFRGKGDLKRHILFHHLDAKTFKCQHCGKVLFTGSSLNRHVKFVHEKISLPKNKICQYCGKGFSTNALLATHIRTHTGERPLQCDLCPATFAAGAARYNHRRLVHKVPKLDKKVPKVVKKVPKVVKKVTKIDKVTKPVKKVPKQDKKVSKLD